MKEKSFLNEELVSLYKRKNCGLFDDATETSLRVKRRRLDEVNKLIKTKQNDARRQKRIRDKRKRILKTAIEQYPELGKDLSVCFSFFLAKISCSCPIILHEK